MKNLSQGMIATALLFFGFSTAAAQCRPEFCVNQHEFVSAKFERSDGVSLRYSACNLSEAPSSFRWSGAGFGVFSPHELAPQYCAYKQTSGHRGKTTNEQRRVSFQGQPSGRVETHYMDGWENYYYSEVTAFFIGEDGRVSIDAIDTFIEAAGQSRRVSVSFGGEIEKVVVALPDDLPFDFELSSEEITSGTLGEFIDIDELITDQNLGTAGSPAFEIRRRESTNDRFVSFSIFTEDISNLNLLFIGIKEGSPRLFDEVR